MRADALEIFDLACQDVMIERKDGRRRKYLPVRYKQQINKGYETDALVPAFARIIRRSTLGFGHLKDAGRPDLMLETLDAETVTNPR